MSPGPLTNGLPDASVLHRLKQLFWMAIDEDYRDEADIEHITAETELSRLPLDSLATIELMYGIEEAFGIYISEEEASELQTVGDILRHIEQGLEAKAESGAPAGPQH